MGQPMPEQYDAYWNSFLPIFFDRITAVMRKRTTEEMAPYGLTSAHATYLMGLTLRDGQTLVSLSRFLDMDTSNTNRVVKVLREKGLIYDDRETVSSKKYSIFLTNAGRKLGEHLLEFTNQIYKDLMTGVTKEEILTTRNTLIKMLNNTDPYLDKYMQSKYENPFYTYLHTNPVQESDEEDLKETFESALAEDEKSDEE